MTKTTFAISDEIRQLCGSIVAKDNPTTQVLAVRTSVAAVVSYLIARLFRLAEAYWAPISTGIGDALNALGCTARFHAAFRGNSNRSRGADTAIVMLACLPIPADSEMLSRARRPHGLVTFLSSDP